MTSVYVSPVVWQAQTEGGAETTDLRWELLSVGLLVQFSYNVLVDWILSKAQMVRDERMVRIIFAGWSIRAGENI